MSTTIIKQIYTYTIIPVYIYCKTVYETKTFAAGEHINLIVMTKDATCEKDGVKTATILEYGSKNGDQITGYRVDLEEAKQKNKD